LLKGGFVDVVEKTSASEEDSLDSAELVRSLSAPALSNDPSIRGREERLRFEE
jgi:hypothetical protein